MRTLLFCGCLFWACSTGAQTSSSSLSDSGHKGQFFAYWGYNRAAYNPSDIHFQGEGYDFTLYNVRAHDLPEQFNAKVYFNLKKFSIPQFNVRVGYYLSDQFSISLGYEHLKYKIDGTQVVRIEGKISDERSETYGGSYEGETIILSPDFLSFEHTNGMNYLRATADWHRALWKSTNSKHSAWLSAGVGTGPVICWTDFTLFGERHTNFLHISGMGVSAQVSARVELFKHIFLQYNSQLGKAFLWDVILEDRLPARADHNVVFMERSLVVGALFKFK